MKSLIEQIENWCAQDKPELTLAYQVPLLGEGGTCSLFGELDDTPFDLTATLTAQQLDLVAQVQSVVNWVKAHTDVDWFGVYLARATEEGKVLTKLAYFGAPSRAEFPLTAEFAALSNNTSVGLSGQKRLINDVDQYRAQGGEYYTCDPKVKSELCWPIFSSKKEQTQQQQNTILGIIDAECFEQNKFTAEVQQQFDAVCAVLSNIMTIAK